MAQWNIDCVENLECDLIIRSITPIDKIIPAGEIYTEKCIEEYTKEYTKEYSQEQVPKQDVFSGILIFREYDYTTPDMMKQGREPAYLLHSLGSPFVPFTNNGRSGSSNTSNTSSTNSSNARLTNLEFNYKMYLNESLRSSLSVHGTYREVDSDSNGEAVGLSDDEYTITNTQDVYQETLSRGSVSGVLSPLALEPLSQTNTLVETSFSNNYTLDTNKISSEQIDCKSGALPGLLSLNNVILQRRKSKSKRKRKGERHHTHKKNSEREKVVKHYDKENEKVFCNKLFEKLQQYESVPTTTTTTTIESKDHTRLQEIESRLGKTYY